MLRSQKEGNFMLRCVRKEGKVFFAYGSKVLISSTPKHFIHGQKMKIILQGVKQGGQEKITSIQVGGQGTLRPKMGLIFLQQDFYKTEK